MRNKFTEESPSLNYRCVMRDIGLETTYILLNARTLAWTALWGNKCTADLLTTITYRDARLETQFCTMKYNT